MFEGLVVSSDNSSGINTKLIPSTGVGVGSSVGAALGI